jgi:hypothetical protein
MTFRVQNWVFQQTNRNWYSNKEDHAETDMTLEWWNNGFAKINFKDIKPVPTESSDYIGHYAVVDSAKIDGETIVFKTQHGTVIRAHLKDIKKQRTTSSGHLQNYVVHRNAAEVLIMVDAWNNNQPVPQPMKPSEWCGEPPVHHSANSGKSTGISGKPTGTSGKPNDPRKGVCPGGRDVADGHTCRGSRRKGRITRYKCLDEI